MSRSQQNADYLSASNYGVKNKIINGNFDVWQRGTSFSVTASGTYTADRYVAYYDGTGATRTLSRQAFTVGQTDVPYEPRYFLRYAQTVAGSGGTANHFAHRIEGARTFAGQTITLSFYAKFASTTSINVNAYQVFGTGGSPSGSVQLNFVTGLSVGTSWTKYTYTAMIPSIAGKTFGSNENDSLDIYFILPINTTFTFDLAQIQLEAGSIATPFEQRPYGMELSLCQRYYYTSSKFSLQSGASAPGSGYQTYQFIPLSMRAAPTLNTTGGTVTNCTQFLSNVDTSGFTYVITSVGSGTWSVLNSTLTALAEL
jgi:hypothetical protein